jgi:malate-CoA ligase subunit alpha
MSILLDEKTPVIVQGFTGKIGSFHAKEMIEYGMKIAWSRLLQQMAEFLN